MNSKLVRRNLKFHLLALPISLSLLVPYIDSSISAIRHLMIFYIVLIAYIFRRKAVLPRSGFAIGLTILLSFGLTNSLITNPSSYDLKFYLLLLSPMLGAFFYFGFISFQARKFIVHLFFMSIIIQVVVILNSKSGIFELGFFQLFLHNASDVFLHSAHSDVESTFSFLFGYFAIYFILARKHYLLGLSILMMLINYKRIVLIGFTCSTIYIVVDNLLGHFKFVRRLIWLLPSVLICFLIVFSSGMISQFVSDQFGMSINQLTTGRYEIQRELFDRLFRMPEIIFGHGGGSTHENVTTFGFTRLTLAHSDYLVLLYDFGILGFVIFFGLFRRYLCRSSSQYAYIVFFFIVLTATNTVVFFTVMFLFYLLLLIEDDQPFNHKVFFKTNP